jgi:hypothetical protein
MAAFCIMRKQFLDRAFDIDELNQLAEMLRLWYLRLTETTLRGGQLTIEARAYAFPRHMGEQIQQSLARRLPGATFDLSDPDELRIAAPAISAGQEPDLSVWREVLAQPLLKFACLQLRLIVAGPMPRFGKGVGDGISTFVLCGAPANGAMLVKAIWQIGSYKAMELVYRGCSWDEEQNLLTALETYLSHSRAMPKEQAAASAFVAFGADPHSLYLAKSDERKVMWLTRHKSEMPDDRGPLGFIRRAGLPLLGGLGCAALVWPVRDIPWLLISCLIGAGYYLLSSARIVIAKAKRVAAYHKRMLEGMGKLYSQPIEAVECDLSNDHTPTLIKCSSELESLGGVLICGTASKTATGILDGNRLGRIGDATVGIGMLRKTENFLFFPPRPVLLIATRFADGRRHFTQNQPRYRKAIRQTTTIRCLRIEGAGLHETLALHRKHVDRMIAAGAVPVVPPTTPAEALKMKVDEFEEGRAAWQKSPYSWSDAVHDAFKICRREFLKD